MTTVQGYKLAAADRFAARHTAAANVKIHPTSSPFSDGRGFTPARRRLQRSDGLANGKLHMAKEKLDPASTSYSHPSQPASGPRARL